MGIKIRLDTLCQAFPRNYLDYQGHIGKNLGLFYRCTGRKRRESGIWFPTYSCYVAIGHDHWYEIDRKGKWLDEKLRTNWDIGCRTGYVCPICGIPYMNEDLKDRVFVVGKDGIYGPGRCSNGQHYYAIGDHEDHDISKEEWEEFETKLDFIKLLGDACMREARGWPHTTSDFSSTNQQK